jgi:hypothetical protein
MALNKDLVITNNCDIVCNFNFDVKNADKTKTITINPNTFELNHI